MTRKLSHRRITAALAAVMSGSLISSVVAGCTSAKNSAPPATPSPQFPIHTPSASPSAGQENQTAAQTTERCTITTVAAIRRYFGAKGIAETVGTSGIGNPTCSFVVRSSNVGAGGVVSVTLSRRSSRAELIAAARAIPGAMAVSGVGDRAFYTARPPVLQFVRAGKRVMVRADMRVPAGPQLRPKRMRADLIDIGRSIAAGV